VNSYTNSFPRFQRSSVALGVATATIAFIVATALFSSKAEADGSSASSDSQSNEALLTGATPVPVSFDGATGGTNPLPAIPEAVEYDRLIRAQRDVGSLDTDLLGESIDYFTGQTDFVTTDVSLPGSNALPVALGRRYHVTNHAGGVLQGAFGDWDLEVPHVEGVFATSVGWTVAAGNVDARCTYFGAPPPATVTTGTVTTSVPAAEYSLGFTAVIPGYGRHELLLRASASPAPAGPHPVTTKDLWAVSCAQRANAADPHIPDEGFVVTTPDGVTYTFTQGYSRPYSPLQRPADTTTAGAMATVDRVQYWLMPSTITDRYGNTVTYQYGATAGFIGLQSIQSSDGRGITLHYSGDHVSSISDGTRGWGYQYAGERLTAVTLPDNSGWVINFANLDAAQWTYASPTCTLLPSPSQGAAVVGTIQHPSGAFGTFTFQPTRHGRNGAPATCLANSVGRAFAPTEPAVYDVLSMIKKQITGPNVPGTLTWNLAYAGCTASSCASSTTTTITDARSYNTLYTFGAQYGVNGSGNEGMLLRKQSGGSGTYPQDEQFTYYNASGNPYPGVIGTPSQVRGDISELGSLRPMQSRTLTRDGASYTRTLSSPDAYGFSQSITRTGSKSKTDSIAYAHDANKWILGTVKTISSSGATEIDLTLNANKQPTRITRFGLIVRNIGYNNDGTVASIDDGNGQTEFLAYKLGVPQSIIYPDASTEGVTVSSLGEILSHTDVMHHTTGYGYDAMGRLRTITPLAGYNQTVITWSPSSTGWTRGTTTGSASTTDTYDAFLHSVRSLDSAGRTVTRSFDADGRPTFVSYAGSARGVTSFYDGMGRLRTQGDGLGYTINTDYGANTVTVTDRNNHGTKYTYMTYDTPSTAWPVVISNLVTATAIERDAWGKPKSIKRDNLLRSLTYYPTQQLETVTEPETGTTTLTYYSNTGNLKTINHAGAATETRTYDLRNHLAGITYSDGSASMGQTWRADGQPDTSFRGGTSRNYNYDDAGLLKSESITVGGTTYTIGYAYDTNQHLKTLTYPDSSAVGYAPDADGRPSQVGSYASSVTFYPNDAVHAFTYGNGITHNLIQDDRTLPQKITDGGILSATYSHDNNGNPLQISDSINATHSHTLTYDSTDRLLTASGPWGSSTFTDDDQDNLTGESGSFGVTLAFDGSNRPDSVTTSGTTQSLTWDTRGRLAQKSSGATATQYTFDAADLLTGLSQGASGFMYTYDALGYRTTADNAARTTTSIYDHRGRLLYETVVADPGTDPKKPIDSPTKYIYLGDHLIAKVLSKADGTTQQTYVHTDATGTPIAQTDSTKAVVGTSSYLAYGGSYNSIGSGIESGPGYANQYVDGTGLIYMHARYYDPQLRRFISADPNPVDANTGINFNRYAYANNNPYAKYDPSGRESGCITIQTDCVDEAGVIQDLQTISQNADSINMAVTSVAPTVGAAEGAAVAAAEEIAETAPAVIDEVGELASVTSRVFTSSDPLVGELATKIDAMYPGHVVGVNVPVTTAAGSLVTDADILLQNSIIQVKSGGGKGLTSQLLRTEGATGLPTIGYGPLLKGSVIQGAQQAGCLVITCELDLLQFISP
jgi:RHS repeat-associated protein